MHLIRKVLIGVLVLATLGSTVFSIVIHNNTGLWIHEVILARPLSENAVESRKTGLVRIYDDEIRGNWEPNAQYAAVMLMKDSQRLNEIGVNTISVVVEYQFKDDETYEVRDEALLYSNIIRAKEKGFSVYLSVNFLGNAAQTLEQIGYDTDLNGFFELASVEALRWAEISEEFNVEYFNAHNEMNCFVLMNFDEEIDDSPHMTEIIGEWHRDILPSVKERFSGIVVAKFCAPGFEYISQTGAMYEGYDIIGMTHQHFLKEQNEYRDFTQERYRLAETMALSAGAEWMIGEGWFSYSERMYGTSTNDAGESLDEVQDDYYRISFEEYAGFSGQQPVGYMFHSWNMPGTNVKGRPAELVIKEFFTN